MFNMGRHQVFQISLLLQKMEMVMAGAMETDGGC